jgi:hypothetical protein
MRFGHGANVAEPICHVNDGSYGELPVKIPLGKIQKALNPGQTAHSTGITVGTQHVTPRRGDTGPAIPRML